MDRAEAVPAGPPDRPVWDVLIRGRRSIGVDLKHPGGRATILALAERADALILLRPVLTIPEAKTHPHNVARGTFVTHEGIDHRHPRLASPVPR